MKHKAAIPLLAVAFALIMAVSLVANAAGMGGGTGGSAVAASTSVSEQTIDEEVFPKDKVIDVKITMDEDDFQDILDNASAEEYKTASVNYNGIQLDNIGIRAKGNLSLRSVVQMEDSDRYSFKLSFDEYVNQTLNGISKINLNNNYSDASYMREFLTYELAEWMGLPTPKYSFVNVYINDELWGFYLAVEQIGESYLEREFGNSNGALYKGVMTGSGSDLQWIDDNIESYSGLEMKSDKSNDDILIDMLDELNNGTDLEKYIDIDDALGYIALNVMTVNSDSYIGSNKQNYYLYENNGVFSILPWDYNMAFGGLGSSTFLIDEPTQGAVAERPLVAKLLAVDEYKERYHEMIQEALDGYLSNEQFSARVQELSDMISSYVEQDPNAFYTYEEYQNEVKNIVSINASNVETYQSQLDGETAISGDGSGSGGGMGGFGGGGMQMPDGMEGGFGGQRDGAEGEQQAPAGDAGQKTETQSEGAQQSSVSASGDENKTASLVSRSTGASTGLTTASYAASSGVSGIVTAAAGTSADDELQGNAGQDTAMDGVAQDNAAQGTASNGAEQDGVSQDTAAGGAAQGNAAQGAAPSDAEQGNAAQGGFGGRMGGMQPPDGMGGGMGGGGFGGPGMDGGQAAAQGSSEELMTTLILLAVLFAACVFVVLFKRKRW